MSAIACLPEELLLHILSFLETPAPSVSSSGEVPTAESLFRASPLETPLKQCSLISRLWRRLCAPLLFKHFKVPLQTILPPVHYCPYVGRCTHATKTALPITRSVVPNSPQDAELDALVAFAGAYDLPRLRPTLMIHQREPCSNIAPLGHSALSRLWSRLYSALSPGTLTIIAPPKNLGELCNREVDLGDSWAFKIALQRIDMSIDPHHSLASSNHRTAISHSTHPEHSRSFNASAYTSSKNHCSTELPPTDPSPLTVTPWTHLTYHAGSHLPVFGEYHYFEKRPPCLLSCTYLQPNGGFAHPTNHDDKLQQRPQRQISMPAAPSVPSLGQTLRKLTYTAVFPHLIHIQSLVKAIMGSTTSTISTIPPNPNGYSANTGIPHLETLELRLTPAPGSRELDDLDLIGRGNLNLRDCWAEVERSYAVIVGVCRRAGSVCAGRNVDSRGGGGDVGVRGRGRVGGTVEVQGRVVDWNPSRRTLVGLGSDRDNDGASSAQDNLDQPMRILPHFRMFISRDVEQGLLKDELESMFTAFAPGWVRDDDVASGVWVRRGENEEGDDGVGVAGPMPWETT